MTFSEHLKKVIDANSAKTAVIWNEKGYTYSDLAGLIETIRSNYRLSDVEAGDVTALKADFSPMSIAVLLRLIELNCIVVPVNAGTKEDIQKLLGISMCRRMISISDDEQVSATELSFNGNHEFYDEIRKRNHPGLVLFSSGTSGTPKAAIHDFSSLLEKFLTPRTALSTMNFLLFDHWGGLNTMFHTLSNGGTLAFTNDRSPENICRMIQEYKIELLPVSPTFLNLLLISEAYKRYDLSSLKVISYGTEPMPQSTLLRINEIFPDIKLQQTYGLIEIGVMRTKSKGNDSLWVKLGGEGYQTRVVDNILQIKSTSSILGYLNYPSPFTDDGWFITGDHVENDGEYFRILGRKSELIVIGGEKVYPVEIEDVIKEVENVGDVVVYSEPHTITGKVICAEVSMVKTEDKSEFRSRIKKHCKSRLQSFKVPAKIIVTDMIQHSERFKKVRPVRSSS